jgi:hypothetical protein
MTTNRRAYGLSVLALGTAALVLGGAAPPACSLEFSEAEIFFELNDSAGDLGIHGSIDGGPYIKLEIEDPRERVIYSLKADGRLALQGLTQLAFESAEPRFDELEPARFFRRFPEGPYEIEATNRLGQELEATVMLSHVMAARPGNITAAGVPSVDCDAPALPSLSAPVLIDWDPVMQSHPTIGKPGVVEIVRYQLFVEGGEGVKFGVDLPPSVTEFEIPAEILASGDQFKFEIIARTSSGNNTAVESCFVLE